MGCGCSENIIQSGDCNSPCLEECTGTEQSTTCTQYDGPDLDNLNIVSGQGLNDVLEAVNNLGITSLFVTKVVVPALNVALLNSQPFLIISAPGANKIVHIFSIYAMIENDNSNAYTPGGGDLIIKSDNATNPAFTLTDAVLNTTNTYISSNFVPSGQFDSIRVNDAVYISDDTAENTGGSSDLALYISYTIDSIS